MNINRINLFLTFVLFLFIVITGNIALRGAVAFIVFISCLVIFIRKKMRFVWADIFVIMLFAWCAISLLWTSPEVVRHSVLVNLMGLAACYFVAKEATYSIKSFLLSALGIICGELVCAGLTITNWLLGDDYSSVNRFTAGDLNANYAAYAMATGIAVISILWVLMRSMMSRKLKIFLVVSYAVSMFSIFLTGSRGATVAALLTSIYFIMATSRKRLHYIVAGGLVLFLGMYLAIDYLPESIKSRLLFQSNTAGYDITSGRLDFWITGIATWLRAPYFGHGFGSFPFANGTGYEAHNFVVSALAETGLVGLILIVLSVVTIFIYAKPAEPYLLASRHHIWRIMLLTWMPICLTGVWAFSAPAWVAFGWLISVRYIK